MKWGKAVVWAPKAGVARQRGCYRSPEWELLLRVARWQPTPENTAQAGAIIESRSFDWSRFMEACFVHQVYPLVAHNAQKFELPVPVEVGVRLKAALLLNRGRAAHLDEAMREIGALLDRNGIPHRFFKGPALARLLYGDPSLRHCEDLDLLVPPDEAAAAAEVVRRVGFRLVEQSRYSRSFAGVIEGRYVVVDVHHGLAPTYLDVADQRLLTDLVNQEAGTPDLALEAVALAVHMGHHRELLLKWVVDLDVLLRLGGFDESPQVLHAVAQRYRAGRFMEAGRRLTGVLLGGSGGGGSADFLLEGGWIWHVPLLSPLRTAWRPYVGKFALIQSRWRMALWLLRYPFLPPPDRERGSLLGDVVYRWRREWVRRSVKKMPGPTSGREGANMGRMAAR